MRHCVRNGRKMHFWKLLLLPLLEEREETQMNRRKKYLYIFTNAINALEPTGFSTIYYAAKLLRPLSAKHPDEKNIILIKYAAHCWRVIHAVDLLLCALVWRVRWRREDRASAYDLFIASE